MPETALFESEQQLDRSEIAAYLRQIADSLDAGTDITLSAGEETVTLSPPERPTFEVTAEREGPTDGAGERSVEFELEWSENGDADLRVE